MRMHIGGEQMKERILMRWMLRINHGRKRNVVEAGKVFLLQEDGTHGKDCPPEQGESLKKKADPARFAYTTIKALTKEQRESFTKMVMEDKDGEDF
jgi:hypothetical protein